MQSDSATHLDNKLKQFDSLDAENIQCHTKNRLSATGSTKTGINGTERTEQSFFVAETTNFLSSAAPVVPKRIVQG